ncbi:MAG: PD-(D/E)XK motif protein [Acidobacteriota bacterium]|nr:PD-(D/E)XK motif protein [Acidobacteriota bacterium]
MKINQIWEELENDMSFSHGLLLRRYSGSVLPDVFIALKAPEKFRCIAASVSSSISLNLSSFSNLKDISVELIPDEKKPEKNILLFKLLENQHKDIFSVLCEDLIARISSVTDEIRLVKELLDRFEKWKSLFDKAASNGLSAEEQRGLFGELYFLRKFLQNNSDFLNIVISWTGCEKQIRDFQSGSWSVEVKTSSGNNDQKVHISSERQLDTSNLENLFLYHFSLESRQNASETLNDIVNSILEILQVDQSAYNRFKTKLLEGGYFERHKSVYEEIGYSIRQEQFYKVHNNFPRIEEKDVRSGVGDVKYTIILSQCSGFSAPEQQVFETIHFL